MKRKKITAVMTALCLTATIGATVYASDKIEAENGNREINVSVNYISQEDVEPDIYKVEIIWGSMAFVYQAENYLVWNPDKLTYETGESKGLGWTCEDGANLITIKNHSNQQVKAKFDFSYTIAPFKGSFSKPEILLDSAVEKSLEETPEETVTFTLDDDTPLMDATGTEYKIGIVKVIIDEVPA